MRISDWSLDVCSSDLFGALDAAAFGDFEVQPLALDGVAVVDGDLGVLQRDLADLGAAALGLVQAGGEFLDSGGVEHGCDGGLDEGVEGVRRVRPPGC